MLTGLGMDLVGFAILFRTRGLTPGYLSIEAYEREQKRIAEFGDQIERWTARGFWLVILGLILQVAGVSLGAGWR